MKMSRCDVIVARLSFFMFYILYLRLVINSEMKNYKLHYAEGLLVPVHVVPFPVNLVVKIKRFGDLGFCF